VIFTVLHVQPCRRRCAFASHHIREVHVHFRAPDDLTHEIHRVEALKDLADMGQVASHVDERHQLSHRALREYALIGILALVGLRIYHQLIVESVFVPETGQKPDPGPHACRQILLVRHRDDYHVAPEILQLAVSPQQRQLDGAAALHVRAPAPKEEPARFQVQPCLFMKRILHLEQSLPQLVRRECQRFQQLEVLHIHHVIMVNKDHRVAAGAPDHGVAHGSAKGIPRYHICAVMLRMLFKIRYLRQISHKEPLRVLFPGCIREALSFDIAVQQLPYIFIYSSQNFVLIAHYRHLPFLFCLIKVSLSGRSDMSDLLCPCRKALCLHMS